MLKSIAFERNNHLGELCNGSTADSDSVCWGSNPYSAAKKSRPSPDGLFFFSWLQNSVRISAEGEVRIPQAQSNLRDTKPSRYMRREERIAVSFQQSGTKITKLPPNSISLFRCQIRTQNRIQLFVPILRFLLIFRGIFVI